MDNIDLTGMDKDNRKGRVKLKEAIERIDELEDRVD